MRVEKANCAASLHLQYQRGSFSLENGMRQNQIFHCGDALF
jgi:hypothetical protein